MRLFFVRHGQTDWNRQDRIQGHTDIPLNTTGIMQAEELRNQIKARGLKFDVVYASPLKRVQKTAEIVADGQNEVIIDRRLMERGAGEFEGRPCIEFFNSEIDFLNPEINADNYGVEPINDFTARVHGFLQDLTKKHAADARILIVSSSGVMKRAYLTLTGGENPPNFSNSEIFELEI